MNLPILIQDANTLSGFMYNVVIDFTGGDWILVGIGLLILVGLLLALGGVRSGGAIAIVISIVFALSLLDSSFIFIFWIGFIIAVFVLMNAIRKKITGQ
jgi:hypothetical protein